jgi:surfactin synthase thioesterase subunit
MTTVHTGRRPRWLLRWPSADAAALLLCLPYAGSGASAFHRWPRRIGDLEVCPIQFPGREDRLGEPHYGTYEALAAQFHEALRDVLDRPFAFFGHCDSALVGFELARALREAGGPVPHRVFASSIVSPDRVGETPIMGFDDDAMLGLLADMARGRGGTLNPELAGMALRVMRADVEACRAYRPRAADRYTCPVTVLAWAADEVIPPDRTVGWEAYGADRRVVLPGGHWDFLAAPPALCAELAGQDTVVPANTR